MYGSITYLRLAIIFVALEEDSETEFVRKKEKLRARARERERDLDLKCKRLSEEMNLLSGNWD